MVDDIAAKVDTINQRQEQINARAVAFVSKVHRGSSPVSMQVAETIATSFNGLSMPNAWTAVASIIAGMVRTEGKHDHDATLMGLIMIVEQLLAMLETGETV